MPYIRVWIQYVWSTKLRKPTLKDEYRNLLFEHIKLNAKSKDIYLDRVNDYHEHVHCLVSLRSNQTIDKIAQLLKGEAAYWFNNKSNFKTEKLEWQDEYFAVSVSESGLKALRAYIDNQVNHHQKKSFSDEYDEFITKYGFERFG